MNRATTYDILAEVLGERRRQDTKWGEQNHVLVDPVIAGQVAERGQLGVAQRMAEEYGIPSANQAKRSCQSRGTPHNPDTWGHILVEEMCEFVEAAALGDVAAAREELKQVAAVAIAAMEAIDRRGGIR